MMEGKDNYRTNEFRICIPRGYGNDKLKKYKSAYSVMIMSQNTFQRETVTTSNIKPGINSKVITSKLLA